MFIAFVIPSLIATGVLWVAWDVGVLILNSFAGTHYPTVEDLIYKFCQDVHCNFTLVKASLSGEIIGGGGSTYSSTRINDDNGNVSAVLDGKKLTDATKKPTDSYWKNGDTVYQLNGTDLTVTNTTTGDVLTVGNFTNGDLGIHLKLEKPPEPRTYTTEEVNDKWYYSLTFWQASNWPASSSNTFAYFDTLPWSIALQNIETSIDGPGKWVPTIVYGNPPGLTCPTVALSQVLSEIQSLDIYNQWKQAYPEDPIILDLNGNGIELTSVQNGVYFDLDNSNFAEKAAWVGTNDAVLVYDRNNNFKQAA